MVVVKMMRMIYENDVDDGNDADVDDKNDIDSVIDDIYGIDDNDCDYCYHLNGSSWLYR